MAAFVILRPIKLRIMRQAVIRLQKCADGDTVISESPGCVQNFRIGIGSFGDEFHLCA
jgi:hypothetical protein